MLAQCWSALEIGIPQCGGDGEGTQGNLRVVGFEPIYKAKGENLVDKEGFMMEGLVNEMKHGGGWSKYILI